MWSGSEGDSFPGSAKEGRLNETQTAQRLDSRKGACVRDGKSEVFSSHRGSGVVSCKVKKISEATKETLRNPRDDVMREGLRKVKQEPGEK